MNRFPAPPSTSKCRGKGSAGVSFRPAGSAPPARARPGPGASLVARVHRAPLRTTTFDVTSGSSDDRVNSRREGEPRHRWMLGPACVSSRVGEQAGLQASRVGSKSPHATARTSAKVRGSQTPRQLLALPRHWRTSVRENKGTHPNG